MVLRHYIIAFLLCLLTLSACREDEYVSYVIDTPLGPSPATSSTITGMYVLCEGNMGSNKCTLDYLDLSGQWTGKDHNIHYLRNIYGQQNPSTVFELGDVGNDIQIYGSRLWIVVNCSNKVEVCHAADARRIGQVNIPNARYITFHAGYAYVSSYVGGVQQGNDAPLGCVYKVDTLSLQKVDSVLVGYQPEEMAVSGNRLYVANSGGYRAPLFDHTMSVIDLFLPKMSVIKNIDIAPNLHHVVADKYGHLWITSRGDYAGTPASLYCLDFSSKKDAAPEEPNIIKIGSPVASFSMAGDTLFCLNSTDQGHPLLTLINTRNGESLPLPSQWQEPKLVHPYGIIANPETHDFYLMDAKNYVSSGELLHFLADGTFDWRVQTGDIPSRAVFLGQRDRYLDPTSQGQGTCPSDPYIAAVDEYVPAPGQFVNTLPLYEQGDDADTMAQKCFDAIGENRQGLVTLGSFGGYITFHFAHPVQNIEGEYDLQIFGNANVNGSEPGIVMVSVDENGNGIPDDKWYELAGSASTNKSDTATPIYNYKVEYQDAGMADIPWSNNQGQQGFIYRNEFHDQPYFPQWLSAPLSFTGTRLPDNAIEKSGNGSQWELHPFAYGYVDNLPNADEDGCSFDLSWAVDPITRQSVKLSKAHFIRVYSAMQQTCGWIGETSTEISGAQALHMAR